MATVSIPNSTTTTNGDTAATANTLALRDSNGDTTVRQMTCSQKLTTGGFTGTVVTKTSNFTASVTEATHYLVDCTGGAVTVSLPTASSCPGAVFRIMKKDSSGNAVTIGSSAVGTTSLGSQYSVTEVFTDGTTWYSK